MTWVAVGGAAGGIIGGALSSSASSSAADEISDAERYAADIQRQMFDQSRQDYLPYMGVGGNALAQLASLYGLYDDSYFSPGAQLPWSPGGSTGGSTGGAAGGPAQGSWEDYLRQRPINQAMEMQGLGQEPSYAEYQQWLAQNPQYQQQAEGGAQGGAGPSFTPTGIAGWEGSPEYGILQQAMETALNRGGRALDRSAAAGGGLLSGAQSKALTDYAMGTQAGMMGSAYGDYVNRLSGLAGTGQTMTQGIGGLGANAATNIGNAAVGAGQAQAAGTIGSSNAWGNALNQFMNYGGQQGGFSNLFGGGGNVTPLATGITSGGYGYGTTPGGSLYSPF